MADRVSPRGVRLLMEQFGVFPKKRMGQNFLVDRNVLVKIADSCNISPEQYLVEIGPGLGGLTQELALRSKGVLAIELDTSLGPLLADLAGELKNLRLTFNDILKIDIEAELLKTFGAASLDSYKVCANIPYNITTPITFKLLEQCPRMISATLMMQKEVGARLLASPGGKEYGRLTIMAAYYADVVHLMDVSRNCYCPRPEVDSVVVRITPRHQPISPLNDEAAFKGLIRIAFQKRRKTILNITSEYFGCSKADAQTIITGIGLEPNLRPEDLSVSDVIRLVNAFVTR